MMHLRATLLVNAACAAILAVGQAAAAGDATDAGCGVRSGRVLPICGLQAPEDLERLPGGRELLVSEFGGLVSGPGRLSALDLRSRGVRHLYPENAPRGEKKWGDAACPGEPGAEFSPHGIHLSRRADGRMQVLVVNHGGRESVEMFELGRTRGRAVLAWRGCVPAGADDFLNDVAALPDGGFLVTVMMKRSDSEALARAFRGENTGYVLRWHPKDGWSRLPGSDAAMPNGVQTDSRGRYAFVSNTGTSQVLKLALPGGERLGAANTAHADNLSWTADGQLLAAGMNEVDRVAVARCRTGSEPECFAPSHVDEIDPQTLRVRRVFDYGNRELHPASIGLRVGNRLYVGSYAGGRLLEVQPGR